MSYGDLNSGGGTIIKKTIEFPEELDQIQGVGKFTDFRRGLGMNAGVAKMASIWKKTLVQKGRLLFTCDFTVWWF